MRIHDEYHYSVESFTIDDAEYVCAKNDDGFWDFWAYMKDVESLYVKYLSCMCNLNKTEENYGKAVQD